MIYYKGDGSGKALSKAAWSWCGSNPHGSDSVTLLAREHSVSSRTTDPYVNLATLKVVEYF